MSQTDDEEGEDTKTEKGAIQSVKTNNQSYQTSHICRLLRSLRKQQQCCQRSSSLLETMINKKMSSQQGAKSKSAKRWQN